MAGASTSGPDSPHTLDMDAFSRSARETLRLYFRKDEANHLVMKIATLNHTVDYMKVALAGLSTGLTLVKADFTLFKVDEKGVSWLGNTLYAFPWTKEGDKWWRRVAGQKTIQKYEDKMKEQEKIERELANIRPYVDKTFYRKSRAGSLNKRINLAQNSADRAHRDIAGLQARLRAAGESGRPTASARNQNFTSTRDSIGRLSQALAGI